MNKLLIIDATKRCNQNCLFCFEKSTHFTEPDLSYNELKTIIVKAKEEGYDYVNFIGGEITMVDWIFDAIKFIKESGMGVGIVTNGIVLSSEEYVKKLMLYGINHIELSFLSSRAKDDYKIGRLKNGLQLRLRALKNIQNLRKYNNENFIFNVNIVISSINYKYLKEIVVLLRKFGADRITIKAVRITDNIKDFRIIPRFSVLQPYLESLMEFLANNRISFTFEDIPLCFITPKYYLKSLYLINQLNRNEIGGYGLGFGNVNKNEIDINTFIKVDDVGKACALCLVKKYCKHPQKEYMDIFQSKEFKPVKNLDIFKKITN